MNRAKSKLTVIILFFAALAAGLAGAGALLLAMKKDFDHTIKHFEFGSLYATAAIAICVAGFLLAVAGFFAVSKKLSFGENGKYSFFEVFASILAGLMCALCLVIKVKNGIPAEAKKAIVLIEVIFTGLSVIHFICKATGVYSKKPAASLMGLCPAFMCVAMFMNIYFSSTDPLNAPLRNFEIVMLVSFMAYFTAEAGSSIGRPKMNRKFVFSGLFAVASGGMVALSRLVARITDADGFGYDIVTVSLYTALWLYVVLSFAEKLFLSREIVKAEAFFDNEPADGGENDAEEGAEKETEEKEEESVAEEDKADGIAGDAVEEASGNDGSDEADAGPSPEDGAEKADETAHDIFERVKAEAEDMTAAGKEESSERSAEAEEEKGEE